MSRQMSCALTIDAVRARTKTVTRRDPDTWTTLKAGDQVTLVEKGMGLKKGEKVVRLAEVEIVDVRLEALYFVDSAEVEREGINTDMTPLRWADWWARSHGWKGTGLGSGWESFRVFGVNARARASSLGEITCRRIEWRYLS